MNDMSTTPPPRPRVLDEMAKRLETGTNTPPLPPSRSDPAPDPTAVAHERAANYVHQISNQALMDLAARRDELDNAMERIKISEKALTAYIAEFTRVSIEAVKTSQHIKNDIAALVRPFSADPPATLTQLTETSQQQEN